MDDERGIDPVAVEDRAAELKERTELKQREAEVQAWGEAGLSRIEIADRVGIAVATVDTYRARIKKRLRRCKQTIEELDADD